MSKREHPYIQQNQEQLQEQWNTYKVILVIIATCFAYYFAKN